MPEGRLQETSESEAPGTLFLDRQLAGLRAALRARDALIASVGYELRNPMTPILGEIERLRLFAESVDGEGDDPQARLLVLAAGLGRLEGLIEAYVKRADLLLDFSRISAGRVRFHRRPIDLARVVRAALGRIEPAAGRAGSAIECALAEDVVGRWDRRALEQVVESLLSNVLKFGAGQPIGVTLHADAQVAVLAIRGRGTGISRGEEARRFARLEAGGLHGRPDLGLGLFVAHRLVGAMRGRITVDSTPGAGSTFVVVLPRNWPRIRREAVP